MELGNPKNEGLEPLTWLQLDAVLVLALLERLNAAIKNIAGVLTYTSRVEHQFRFRILRFTFVMSNDLDPCRAKIRS